MIGLGIGGRGIGLGLGRSAGAAAESWWLAGGVSAANCVAAYQPKGAASLAASYSNLANPGTYDAAPGVAPTWNAATGWTFNGSTQYLTAVSGLTADSTIIVRASSIAQVGNQWFCGYAINLPYYLFISLPDYNLFRYQWGDSLAQQAPSYSAGCFAIAGGIGFYNGVPVTAQIGNYSGACGVMYVGSVNIIPQQYANCTIPGSAFYSSTLTTAQVAAISAALAAL